jgi:hypothetical protein
VSGYVPPPWLTGSGDNYDLTVSDVARRDGHFTCPGKVAHNARRRGGSVQPNDSSRWRPVWDDSEGVWMSLVDTLPDVETGTPISEAVGGRPHLTAGQRRFVTQALHELSELRHLISDAVGTEMTHAGGNTSQHDRGHGQVRLTGPEYTSADGTIRESVRFGFSQLRDIHSAHLQDHAATAAMVLARARPELQRIRVTEFTLASGAYTVLFDGSPADAAAAYQARTDDRGHLIAQALDNTRLNPGAACGGCSFLQVCPAPAKIRSVLGIDTAVATRAITSNDLAAYDDCPARFQLQRRSHLAPRPREDQLDDGLAPSRRGEAAHKFLQWAHRRSPSQGCTEVDLPDPGVDPAAVEALLAATGMTAAGLDVQAYTAARPYLVSHLEHCLLGYAGFDDVAVEPRHTVYDPDADVVIVATPDLTLRAGSAPVWRETKTRAYTPPQDERDALNNYPAFALHVTLLAAGVAGNSRDDGTAELEVLTPMAADSRVFIVPLSDGGLVAHAQKIVAQIAGRWSQDSTFEPKPSSGCGRCPMYGWCLPPEVGSAPPREPDDREFLGYDDPF